MSSITEVVDVVPTQNLAWSDEELGIFKARLIEEHVKSILDIQTLTERVLEIEDRSAENGSSEGDACDFGSMETERRIAGLEVVRLQKYLKKIDEAMLRIENGTYGICVSCNCKINKDRLLAVPITTLSATYKITKTCPIDGIDRAISRR